MLLSSLDSGVTENTFKQLHDIHQSWWRSQFTERIHITVTCLPLNTVLCPVLVLGPRQHVDTLHVGGDDIPGPLHILTTYPALKIAAESLRITVQV